MFQLPLEWNTDSRGWLPSNQMQLFMMTAMKMQYPSPPGLPGLRWFEGKVFYKLVPTAGDIIQQELSLKGTFPFQEIYWDLLDQDGIPEMELNGMLSHAVWYNTQSTSPNQDVYDQNGVS